MKSVDKEILVWAASVLGNEPSFSLAAPQPNGEGVTLHLMRIAASPAPRGTQRPPLQIKLHYLVLVQNSDVQKAHEQLTELLFAAMATADYEVLLDTLNDETWLSYGLPPQPAFVLALTLRRMQPETETRRILHPMETEIVMNHSIHGLVLGQGDIPVSNAIVELPNLKRVMSNHRGEFALDAVPSTTKKLIVHARGESQTFEIDAFEQPLILRITFPDS